jgi:hypothetical protein
MLAEIESIDRQIAFKESEVSRLRGVTAEYQRRVDMVPTIESQWVVLSRDYETLQAAYRELLNKSESARLAIDLEQRQMGDQFRVLDNARVPEQPAGPDRLRISLFGLMSGLVFGVLIAGLLEARDASYRSEADVHQVLALPVIAVVPYVLTSHVERQQQRKRFLLTTAATVTVVCAAYVFWTLELWKIAV